MRQSTQIKPRRWYWALATPIPKPNVGPVRNITISANSVVSRTNTKLEQHFPIQLGSKQIRLATVGTGAITSVTLNGQPWRSFDEHSVLLPCQGIPERTIVVIVLGDAAAVSFAPQRPGSTETLYMAGK